MSGRGFGLMGMPPLGCAAERLVATARTPPADPATNAHSHLALLPHRCYRAGIAVLATPESSAGGGSMHWARDQT